MKKKGKGGLLFRLIDALENGNSSTQDTTKGTHADLLLHGLKILENLA
jgi:hypothetical protein